MAKRKPKNDYISYKKYPTKKDTQQYAKYMQKPKDSATKIEQMQYNLRTDLVDIDFRITEIYYYFLGLLLLSNIIILILGYWDKAVIVITILLIIFFEFSIGIIKRRKRKPYKKLTTLKKWLHGIGIIVTFIVVLGFLTTNIKTANLLIQIQTYENKYTIIDSCENNNNVSENGSKCVIYDVKNKKEIEYNIKPSEYFSTNIIVKEEKDLEIQ